MGNTKNLFHFSVGKIILLALLVVGVFVPASAQTADVRYAGVFYLDNPSSNNAMYCDYSDIKVSSTSGGNRSFVFTPNPTSRQNDTDPWVSSALIEYDQPYPSATPEANKYPNHCLALCMNVQCFNKPLGGSTYSISFPLQQIRFDIVKYYNNKNVENAEETPPIRTIDLYPNQESARCGSYACPGGHDSGNTCNSAAYYCDDASRVTGNPLGCPDAHCHKFENGLQVSTNTVANVCKCQSNGVCNFAVWNNDGIKSNGNEYIPFCAAWDGSYEIAGEFGKTNGQFAYRATVSTDVPGDNQIVDKINFNSTIAYPGMNQIPIQVDVTNIHTVRSTPSVVGNITAVSAQPYTYSYRLSKDADVRIAVFDASNEDAAEYASGYFPTIGSTNREGAQNLIVRTLVDWQPRLGEGMKGRDGETQITEFDSWDGRGDNGLLLPAGNYIVSLQAKSADEWPGIDFSRAVTRQLSLDPLKLTDIVATGLTKQSTAYASIAYTPTESSKVYWYIYTPGTVFNGANTPGGVLTDSSTDTGTEPTVTTNTGGLVYQQVEDRVGRMNFTSKWDGTCQIEAGCKRFYPRGDRLSDGTVCGGSGITRCEETFAYGAPMPDGNYVYVLWAEIPYNGKYVNAVGGNGTPGFTPSAVCRRAAAGQSGDAEINGQCFTGVKTLKYNTGEISVERGVVDVTIQPVSYSTVGSSPTAYGLDPFIFKYSLSRDATVVAKVTNSAGVDVKYLTPKEGVTQVAQQMNTISWDGRDDAGRMVTPGTYMFVVDTKDAMFPAVTNRASAVFPVDMYRVVDLATTDVYGDSEAKATISYSLSKAMNVQVNIYNKDVVIPNYQTNVGDYAGFETTASTTTVGYADFLATNGTMCIGENCTWSSTSYTGDVYTLSGVSSWPDAAYVYYGGANIYTVTVRPNPQYDANATNPAWNELKYVITIQVNTITTNPSSLIPIGTGSATGVSDVSAGHVFIMVDGTTYTNANALTVPGPGGSPEDSWEYQNGLALKWTVTGTSSPYSVTLAVFSTAMWPPRICDRQTDGPYFTAGGSIDPSKKPTCIYVNDTSFTNYPATPEQVAAGVVDVRLQPVKTFERSSMHPGDGIQITEEWDALYFRNPNNCPAGSTDLVNCSYEMVPDGQYPFYISARSNEPFNRYYAHSTEQIAGTNPAQNYLEGAPFRTSAEVKQEPYLYATDKVTGKLNITRGAVYFLDGSTVVYPNAPQLFNVSSGPVFVPPYEINFSVSRAATVEIAIVALQDNVCNPDPTVHQDLKNNRAGDVCKYLSTMTIMNMHGVFDPNIIRKTYWDGTDNNGFYVKPAAYEVRLTARNYPNPDLYQATVKSITVNADLLKVFDLLEADGYAISQRGTNMKIGYQVSVPMKVVLQILKPGTTIYDYQKGTLRNPTTGTEVQDIHEVLVKSIVGIRPATTLIEEVWDGTDYAGQEVPDGTYPFRFVTATNSADIDSVTGEIVHAGADDSSADSTDWKINYVADTYEYQNLHKATVAIGDGKFVCEDWEKTVFFYPNPFTVSNGTLEITKMPGPGEVSIKIFNLAGDLVRDSGYECVDANNYKVTMGSSLKFQPDNDPAGSQKMTALELSAFENVRNAALRCRWDKTNQHGKRVAHGVYFGLVDFKTQMGRDHCQKVVKILIP